MKNSSLFRGLFFSLILAPVCFAGPFARAEDPLLEVQVFPDQNSVRKGMMFLNRVEVTNSSADTSVDFWSNSCSYEKHWVTDNPAVRIQSWTCNENTLEEVMLDPGNSYEKNIILYVPDQDKTRTVTFRLGFKRMSEDGDVAEPIWSGPVTMNVIVPEGVSTGSSSDVVTGASRTEQVPEASDQPEQMSSTPAVPGADQPFMFSDPGVPIQVPVGKEFSISLVSNPSTGFRWKMTLPEDNPAVRFLGSDHQAPNSGLLGAPGEEVFKFKALTPGEVKIDFVYERPWEARTAPTRKIFTVLVQTA